VNLATAWFDGLAFLCPVCLLESQDSACDICGRPLTANDLAPMTSNEPPASSTEATGGSSTEGV
jgi:hypothetical protein